MKLISSLKYVLALAALCILAGSCRMQKETSVNRGLQNLTARYNVLYNARLLLEEHEISVEDSYFDDFSQVLPLYKEAANQDASPSPLLDSIIKKAYKIVNEKNQSKYVDDAYFTIAKANYLKGNFYDAVEFFTYVFKTYPAETDLRLSALAWKTRALLHLNNMEEASVSIDTALRFLSPSSKARSEVYAAYTQFLINTGRSQDAIESLKKALEAGTTKRNHLRWTYILAQLQEMDNQQQEAFLNYTKVAKSNVSFEMSFNAELNRIRMSNEAGTKKTDRVAALRSMLKSDKNKDFSDQIYYRIGDIYSERQQTKEAIASYIKATKQPASKNPVHKGLAYLKLADIYFKSGNYTKAKAYYDTTLTTLPETFAGYGQIKLKSAHLDLLADRYRIIAREDTLQTLARMTDAEREDRIGQLVREQTQKSLDQAGTKTAETPGTFTAAIDYPASNQTEGKFYFNNSAAISQGFSDFKRRWGNRPPADDWRRGTKTSSDVTQNQDEHQTLAASQPGTTASQEERIKQNILKDLPVSPEALKLSNERIAGAYYDIAIFYREDLKDEKEAVKTLEELLARVPESSYTPAVYYNLYLLYAQKDPSKSNEYRERLIKRYPESAYAKAITNPGYVQDASISEEALNEIYSTIYDLYTQRKYSEVIDRVSGAESSFGNNKFSPQFAYLKALAIGHTQKLAPFEGELQTITNAFSADQLIVPLVRQHLKYIDENRNEFLSRPTALLDYDPDNNIFMEPAPVTKPAIAQVKPEVKQPQPVVKQVQPETAPATVPAPATAPVKAPEKPEVTENKDKKEDKQQPVSSQPVKEETPAPVVEKPVQPVTETAPAVAQKPSVPAAKFNMPEVAEYYFVVNVNSATVDLSPSRFGIGQFNRSKYSSSKIKHQLKSVNNENQLIFVGPFNSLTAVRSYEKNILPLIKDIMKIASERYNTFVVSKDELDKLNSRALIDSYAEFYKNYK